MLLLLYLKAKVPMTGIFLSFLHVFTLEKVPTFMYPDLSGEFTFFSHFPLPLIVIIYHSSVKCSL